MKYIISVALTLLFVSCSQDAVISDDGELDVGYKAFVTYKEFKETLISLSTIEDEVVRNEKLTTLIDSLQLNNQVPFVMNDSVAFIYKGSANKVQWAGDFNSWNPATFGYTGTQLGETDVFILEKTFPSDARLDYKVVVDDKWMLDPLNDYIQYSGFGPNSELRMQAWKLAEETVIREDVNQGQLSEYYVLDSKSENLGYKVQYKVYVPHGYESLSNLPVVYVTDGHEYSDQARGAMITVLDNLIHDQIITPVIAVFIDPRNPDNLNENRRMSEYRSNKQFADFVADELVPVIDEQYKTNSDPESRAILGTSLGGWNSAYFGIARSETFQLIVAHSPAFSQELINDYQSTPKLPLKIFIGTGVINDTEQKARAMKSVLEDKGYQLRYMEVNEGHSWGNWRAMLKEPLVYLFGI